MGAGSAAALAKKCKIDAKTVRSALDGKIPSHQILQKISDNTGKSIEWILGVDNKPDQQGAHTLSEPTPTKSIQKYEHLVWKFQHIFDFLLDFHEDDSITINDFVTKLENDIFNSDPNYRLWIYQKREEAAERQKKRATESDKIRPMEDKSADSGK